MPNDLSAHGYVELITHQDGAAHFAVWVALLMVASKATPRGTLLREDGRPHTPESLALVTRLSMSVIEAAIARLLEMGFLENGGHKPRKKNNLTSHPGAAMPQTGAIRPQEGAAEGNRTEHHRQEGNRTENEIELNRSSFSPSKNGDDDDENPTHYVSPDEELKAIYESKASEAITFAVLDAIRANLEFNAVAMSDFVAEVKKHTKNEWRNPPGFLRNLSKRFRTTTQTAGPAVTAAEAAEKNYQCPRCSSRIRGEGAIVDVQGGAVPCTCASEEYIARQRARGIFSEAAIQ